MDPFVLPILMFGAVGLMMYFGMRKQKRQAAETQKMQNAVVPGARIMTTSGLHGTVTAVADDTIELEIAPDVRTTWVRAAVREVVVPVADDTEQDEALEDGAEFDDDFETEFDDADGDAAESDQVSVDSDEGDSRDSDVG